MNARAVRILFSVLQLVGAILLTGSFWAPVIMLGAGIGAALLCFLVGMAVYGFNPKAADIPGAHYFGQAAMVLFTYLIILKAAPSDFAGPLAFYCAITQVLAACILSLQTPAKPTPAKEA